ncbi:hypothetical protein E2562_033903 [Oryza meyeriana var. granulata]|uniref:Uncharacterized protein n=1 Tax=Oryza meyeriana var. granulata TaxID=110450 RepID=A0A6G1BPG9_9ORYZ|nr:hypothetical protein E2562_033903 [Oryza meyeriana var. granulata]
MAISKPLLLAILCCIFFSSVMARELGDTAMAARHERWMAQVPNLQDGMVNNTDQKHYSTGGSVAQCNED